MCRSQGSGSQGKSYLCVLFNSQYQCCDPPGLPDPDPLVRGMDPDPNSSIIKQNSKKNLDSYCFLTSFALFIFEKLFKK